MQRELREIYREIERLRDIEAPIREQNIQKVAIKYFLGIMILGVLAEIGLFKLLLPLLPLLDGWTFFLGGLLFIALLGLYDHLVKCHKALVEKDQMVYLCYELLETLAEKEGFLKK